MAAAVAPIVKRLGGHERKFGLLTVEDLCELTASLPLADTERELLDAAALYQWASNVKGCAGVLFMAAQKHDPKLTLATVEGWGSIMQRRDLARLIMSKSLTNGEEPEADATSDANPTPPPATGG